MNIFICLFILGNVYAIYGKVLPDAISKYLCHRSDPNINECLLNSVHATLPLMAKGIPEANLAPLDPLNVEFMTAEGDLENIKVKIIMKNITLSGHSNTKVTRVKFDPTALSGEVTYIIPTVHMTAEYYASGRLFVIPLESSAYFDGDFGGVEMGLNIRLKTVQRKGVKYFSVDKLSMKMHIDSGKIKLTSVDPTQQAQVNVIQNFFNENDRLVLDTVNPIAIEHGGEFYKHVLERILRSIPAEELFPY